MDEEAAESDQHVVCSSPRRPTFVRGLPCSIWADMPTPWQRSPPASPRTPRVSSCSSAWWRRPWSLRSEVRKLVQVRLSVLVLYDNARQIRADWTFICLLNNNCRERSRRRGNCEVTIFFCPFIQRVSPGSAMWKSIKLSLMIQISPRNGCILSVTKKEIREERNVEKINRWMK